jgi:hypothetical protein
MLRFVLNCSIGLRSLSNCYQITFRKSIILPSSGKKEDYKPAESNSASGPTDRLLCPRVYLMTEVEPVSEM